MAEICTGMRRHQSNPAFVENVLSVSRPLAARVEHYSLFVE